MPKNAILCLGLAFAATLPNNPAWAAAAPLLKPAHLTCDSLTEPLGIDTEQPSFSWQLQDARSGARQTAYRIGIATKPTLLAGDNANSWKADVWDSARVSS